MKPSARAWFYYLWGYNAHHWAPEQDESWSGSPWDGAQVGLQILIRQSGDVTILDLQGRATIGRDTDTLNGHLRKLIDGGTRNVLLNLIGLTQLDSSSLSTIVRASVGFRRNGGSLKLLRPHGSVKLVLETLHLLDAVPHFEDEAEAVASFS